ncbi:benzyl alcohol O-benzoyltransferase-like [Panicum miliaceum]|uniref:Benzyl alcohol O-benzoyltransferase-like n=1 Tax=Panicum miliaceum TaxID=4540 RepID=A0A3L6SY54_PANMI|nr:benzyl alcohol O-benzoyltransferase-like [Panicum miliaceum]
MSIVPNSKVTRLLCGGFVLALRVNHTICDAIGLVQFLSAVAELARGLPAPTVSPAWSRELLEARSPPHPRPEPDAVAPVPPPPGVMVLRTFTFSPADVGAIRSGLPPGLRNTATSFEVLMSALWRARTAALELPPNEDVRLVFIANFRGVPGVGLPAGYYGNACVPVPVLRTTVEALLAGSLGHTVELVREAKATVTAEYVRSVAVDLGVLRRRPYKAMANAFVVSDSRRAGFHCLDFGWGVPVYGGPSSAVFGVSFLIAVRNGDGENAAALSIVLPRPAMDRFAVEVDRLFYQCKASL